MTPASSNATSKMPPTNMSEASKKKTSRTDGSKKGVSAPSATSASTMRVSSDEVNFLVWRYLQETGFVHTAFTFAYESMVRCTDVQKSDVPPGALISFLQKGLQYVGIEETLRQDGNDRQVDKRSKSGKSSSGSDVDFPDFTLLSPHAIRALTRKEPPIRLNVPPAAAAAAIRVRLEAEARARVMVLESSANFAPPLQNGPLVPVPQSIPHVSPQVSLHPSYQKLQPGLLHNHKNSQPPSSLMNQNHVANTMRFDDNGFGGAGAGAVEQNPILGGRKSQPGAILQQGVIGMPLTQSLKATSEKEYAAATLASVAMRGSMNSGAIATTNKGLTNGMKLAAPSSPKILQHLHHQQPMQNNVPSATLAAAKLMDMAATERMEAKPTNSISTPMELDQVSGRLGNTNSGQVGVPDIPADTNITNVGSMQAFNTQRIPNSAAEINAAAILSDNALHIRQKHTTQQHNTQQMQQSEAELAAAIDNDDSLSRARPEEVLELNKHTSEVFMCAWNPIFTQLLATGSGDASARIWEMRGQNAQRGAGPSKLLQHGANLSDRKNKDVTTLEWSSNGELLATGSYDGVARVWTRKGDLVHTLHRHLGPIFSLKWNKRGNYLLSGSYDKTTIVWDVSGEQGVVKQQFGHHVAPALDVDWKDDNTFASCSTDKTVLVCRVGSSAPLHRFAGHTDEVNAVKWDPSGTLLASCSDDYTAKVWDMSSNSQPLHDFKSHKQEIYTVKWSPTGPGSRNPTKPPMLATASFDGSVRLWNIQNGSCITVLSRHRDSVYSVSFSPSGEYLASGSLAGQLYIWQVQEGKHVKSFKGKGDIFEVAWNVEETRVAACFSSNVVNVIDFKV
eukprot:CAMPEP_0198255246 /NCGR_PEP_ID=MMETSP1447-20131203/5398_1 /TAXON_ID=420782 /ORGANISM="Chaetoceros dichaeta, Strain CCMP1751" /LENGTH=845 /DNA_ID=CAMNT_0043941567 /DNA_START=31 /DNA_END=2568 /DNA_ORIENTATION=-